MILVALFPAGYSLNVSFLYTTTGTVPDLPDKHNDTSITDR